MTDSPKIAKFPGKLTRMGVRQYRQDIPRVIREGQPIVIERHGQPVGLYIPIKQRNHDKEARLMQELADSLKELWEASGLSEEELAQLIEEELQTPLAP